jgi:hypothetical protein
MQGKTLCEVFMSEKMRTVSNTNGEAVGSTVHVFERAGLGKAPFNFVSMNRNAYQACPGAPVQPGGTCDYCGSSIMFEFFIKSADGKTFKVGSDCVCKTDDQGLRRVVDAKVREMKRKANTERQDAKIARAKELLPLVADKLKGQPHPQDWRAKQGQTRYDCLVWYLANAGRSGACWAAKIIEDTSKN